MRRVIRDGQPLTALRYMLRKAAIVGAEAVKARLPLDPALAIYRGQLRFYATLWRSSEGGNMMRVLNLRGLLEAIECELAARLQAAQHAPGAVGCACAVDRFA